MANDIEVHGADCSACDVARAVVVALREQFDPLDNWDEVDLTADTGSLTGRRGKPARRMTVAEMAVGLVANELHRSPLQQMTSRVELAGFLHGASGRDVSESDAYSLANALITAGLVRLP